ncbi:hypothetical protein ONZ45_g14058 [Pleurotus djamor]|nr:hypothetical protein ONZ45_g14058 [Pleurotus djamor]
MANSFSRIVVLGAWLGLLGALASSQSTVGSARAQPSQQTGRAISDPSSFVTLFIGTTKGGHVFPGATLPHGMVKTGMDTDSPGNHAGYDADPQFNATGFSQLHDSGTGGAVPLSNFKLWPFAECSSFDKCPASLNGRKTTRKILSDGSPDDFASPGYFATNLNMSFSYSAPTKQSTDIRVELTATRRTALHRYTFPASSTHPRMVVDITNDGQRSSTNPSMVLDPQSGRVKGGASFAASFGPGRYSAFTCVDFKGQGFTLSKPLEFGAWLADFPVQGMVDVRQLYTSFVDQLGALLTFAQPVPNEPTVILARVGVSLISAEQACTNAEEEIPDFNFEGVQSDARQAWNDVLGRIQVDTTGVPRETVELFYSSLYRTHISPADYTGENPKWNSTEPYFDSFYCNWDTYRTLYPLMSLHDPVTFSRIVRGMIDIQRHEGWLPECRGATAMHFIQGGSNADPILGEFFVKFSEHAAALNVSASDLYTALLADAELQPPNWNLQGRQADVWKRLSKKDDARKYSQRAGNFANVWNPNITVPDGPASVVGMMQPRFANGTFNFTDPRHCSIHDPAQATCFLNAANRDGFYEGSPIIYSQYAPQDTAKLIELQGGIPNFISRLNFIFDQDYFESTDEPSQQMPFMYHYANRPGLSTQRSRQVIAQFFNTSTNGLPGNDDSGAMGSYVSFYLAGLYPLPATKQFLLSSPFFKQISFFNPVLRTTTTIRSKGFNGNPIDGTGGSVFVKSVTIDGKPSKSSCFLDWDVFVKGSLVELTLSNDINVTCGNGKAAIPPSLSTGGYD